MFHQENPFYYVDHIDDTDYLFLVRHVANHTCDLPINESDDLIFTYIDSGLFVESRRRLRRFIMVSDENPQSKALFKSTARIRSEKARHLKKHYGMIHPFSECRILWETVMIVTYIVAFLTMPIEMGFVNPPDIVLYMKLVCDLITYVDVVMNFKTGYLDMDIQWVVMSSSKVTKKYLFTHFLPDIIGALPMTPYLRWTEEWKRFYLKFTFIAKLFRLNTLSLYVGQCLRRNNINSNYLTPMKIVFYIFVGIHWASGTILLLRMTLGEMRVSAKLATSNQSAFIVYLDVWIGVVRKFMLHSINENVDTQWTQLLVMEVVCLIAGAIINMFVLAKLFQIYGRRMNAVREYDEFIKQIFHYVQFKQLSIAVKDRIIRSVQFKFQKRLFKEAAVMDTLSRTLREDILYHNCNRLMEKVEFFNDLPTDAMLRILSKLKQEIYLSGDVIVQAGTVGNAMYFIYLGTVAVFTSGGHEICHLSEGGHFGEIALLINEPRVATVVAVKDCELIRLSRRDFNEALEPFPELKDKFARIAMARLHDTLNVERNEELRRE